jgi:16S rRNA processing protein RimM
MFDDYYFLGKIFKPHGYKGKVNMWLDVDDPSEYESLKMVYLDKNGMLIPYFINTIHILNNKAVVDFQDVDNIEKAELLSDSDIYLPLSELPELTGNQFYFHEVIGFSVVDKNWGNIGDIRKVFEYPSQAVMQVFFKKKEVLIPINPHVVLELDREKKEIKIDAPDGLIDLYLNS